MVPFFNFSAILLLVWVYFHPSFMSFPCRAQTTMSCYVTNFESLLKEFSSNDMTKPFKAIIGVANFSVNFPLQRKAAFLHQTSNGKIHCKSFLQPSSSQQESGKWFTILQVDRTSSVLKKSSVFKRLVNSFLAPADFLCYDDGNYGRGNWARNLRIHAGILMWRRPLRFWRF